MRDAIEALAGEYELRAQRLESLWASDPGNQDGTGERDLMALVEIYEEVARDLRNLAPTDTDA